MNPQEAAMAYFKSMPKKEKRNPYWKIEGNGVRRREVPHLFTPVTCLPLLEAVRTYFRNVYESFGTEAQVLCVHVTDAPKLEAAGIPVLGDTMVFDGIPVKVFVLPQYNTPVNSIVSDDFWQNQIAGNGITPVARIHSHHILDAYQSSTDYSTLNSNTLELVMGRINEERFHIAWWLDCHGTDTKSRVWHLTEGEGGSYGWEPIQSGKLKTEVWTKSEDGPLTRIRSENAETEKR